MNFTPKIINHQIEKIFNNKFLIFFISVLLSIFFFRGRIGSDDLEVFNFVYNFYFYDGNILNFLDSLRSQSYVKIFYNSVQQHHFHTWEHRFIWILQTYFIFNISLFFSSIDNLDNLFVIQYLSGFILTLYAVLSFFIFLKILKEKFSNYLIPLFFTISIFFGTGLINFFTGAYIESLIILFVILRVQSKTEKYKIFFDLMILSIKPYYLVCLVFLRFSEVKKHFFEIKKKDIYILLRYYLILLSLFLIYRFGITNLYQNLNYLNQQHPNLELSNIIKNLYLFYFSNVGIFYTQIVLIIFLILGWEKKVTIYKLVSIFILTIFLSFWDGFHGGVGGNRFLLPMIFIFTSEIIRSIKEIINKKNNYLFIKVILLISILLNLPSAEYKVFNITEYENKTVIKNIPKGPVVKNFVNKPAIIYPYNLKDMRFNYSIFAFNVFLHKLVNKKQIVIDSYKLETRYIYPATGLARVIYLVNNNIKNKNIPKNKILKILPILKLFYFFIILFFLTIIFYSFINCREKL